ncbi:hypothetical protein FQA39_LY12574 [Lamprigera yunnana]|nr:hypothetical protein FQA39_LY12574 [Lamprigera yunnana]
MPLPVEENTLQRPKVVTEAVTWMNISNKDRCNSAPLAASEIVVLDSEYAQVKDVVYPISHELRQRREKRYPSYSNTDSE